ncbi:MAG: helix-turn-helix domain-containing protein [Thermoplasmata archaeon]|nr:helix-turn-helix domain-containing protein [Thermoplasmata archaeon]MCI4359239.1 helix-turn-helix domain-containing protein [Thermoplasmata archaeon]
MPKDRERERTIERIRTRLETSGFYVSDAHHIRPTAFDLMARRDSLLLILKILKNIDALDSSEAKRLHDLASLFAATVILVGKNSGATPLEPGVVYSRYDIPILVEESLEEYFAKGVPPFLFSSPGGIFARIDGTRLRELRDLHRLSLGALATIAGVSRRTIQLYEEGGGAETSIVERIERYMGEPIAMPIDFFHPARPGVRGGRGPSKSSEEGSRGTGPAPERDAHRLRTGDPFRDTVLQKLDGMGWDVVVTVRCPFDAFSSGSMRGEEEILITAVGSLRSAQHRADLLQQIARVAEGHALFIVGGSPTRRSIEGLPILTMHELRRHRDPQELMDDLTERESA